MKKHHRRSIRLKDYDYTSAGYYFVTICTQDRLHLFGEITNGKMILNGAGIMVDRLWYEIARDFPNVYLHEFVVMPNHIHGIIEITNKHTVGAESISALLCSRADMESAPTLGKIVQSFKGHATLAYIKMVKNGTVSPFKKRIWQRNYHEHIIRDEVDYERVATYTVNNPLTWDDDLLSKSLTP